ncbi:MAG: beta-galactosidase [Candidatus Saganbacteria bacterium]|nr:beta-galactosidase [Candidatus Saganbacteria bacterium]
MLKLFWVKLWEPANELRGSSFHWKPRRLVSGFLVLFLFSFASVSAFSVPPAGAGTNLLRNSSFEEGLVKKIPRNWGEEYYFNEIVPGFKGQAVKISNKKPAMSIAAQLVNLPAGTKKVQLTAYIKAQNVVPGKEIWNKMNIQVLFFDKDEKQLGGYPQLGPWTGSFDWKFVGRQFFVPKGAVKSKVVFGLYDATGVAYFDEVKLETVSGSTDQNNLIQNGGFEIWEGWAYGGSEDWAIVYPAQHGVGALYINNKVPLWSFASQSIPLDGKKVKKLKIEAYIKAENIIQGKKPWQKARLNIEFKNRKGKRIGGWPIVGSFTGSISNWQKISNTFAVPEETTRVDLFAGLLECQGKVWFDSIKVEGFTDRGAKVNRPGTLVTDKRGWYKFAPVKDTFVQGATDLSYLLDSPAGKHGFMKVKNGHFYFADGTRARFWGTNLYPPMTFPSQKDAEYLAKRLAKSGCNLVRIHHLDAFWANPNIFDSKYNDTQHINPKALEKLDYLIYQLKQNGIYVFMDLLVDRKFKKGDGVVDYENVGRGAKISGFYNRRIIDLQKRYARQILQHKNPYTGLRYVDDPAIVSYKLINEAMLYYIGTQFGLSKVYIGELDSLYNNWLRKKYGSRTGLQKGWTDRYGRCDLGAGENFGNVSRADTPLQYQRGGSEKVEPFRERDTMEFYYDIQVKYFREMAAYLKKLGAKVPISGSNHWVNIEADVKANAVLDYIDRHRYWDHPQFGYGTKVVFENQPMVKNPKDALPNNFAYYKVANKPFVVSEWNSCFPNEYRAEGPLFMAAYANLHDWDGVLQFSFNHAGWTAPMKDNFDISQWPNVWSQWQSAALIFHRGDVAAAKNTYKETFGDKDIFGRIYEDSPIADEPLLPLITKTEIDFGQFKKTPDADTYLKRFVSNSNKSIRSDTGELNWNYGKGIFTINTGKTQAALGFMKGQNISLSDVTFAPQTGFATLALSSLDNNPISSSSRLLLTAAARIENRGQKYIESKTQLKEVGEAPIEVEGVDARISLKRRAKAVYALDVNGNRKYSVSKNSSSFNIRAADRAFYYEIVY